LPAALTRLVPAAGAATVRTIFRFTTRFLTITFLVTGAAVFLIRRFAGFFGGFDFGFCCCCWPDLLDVGEVGLVGEQPPLEVVELAAPHVGEVVVVAAVGLVPEVEAVGLVPPVAAVPVVPPVLPVGLVPPVPAVGLVPVIFGLAV
jgi:hypothetical protein